jgi:cobalt-zinc-cadmium efflux system protein
MDPALKAGFLFVPQSTNFMPMSSHKQHSPGHHGEILPPHQGHHHGAVKNIRIAFFLNLGFSMLELVGGLMTNSMAILSDALHDLGDSISLGLSWYFEKVASKKRDHKYTYGYARFSVLAALINGLILILGSAFILAETIPRLLHPEQSDAKGMLILAGIGVAVNGVAALRLFKGETVNERMVAMHLVEDLLGWVAIIVGSIVMIFVEIPILDPILSLLIMGYVLFNVVGNLRKSIRIFLQANPLAILPAQLEHELLHVEGVKDIHDLHVWSLDGQYHVATLHVAVSEGNSLELNEEIKHRIREKLTANGVAHATLELEAENHPCKFHDCSGPEISHDHHHHH